MTAVDVTDTIIDKIVDKLESFLATIEELQDQLMAQGKRSMGKSKSAGKADRKK